MQMHKASAKAKYKHAYHILRSGREISWTEMLALGRVATSAATEAVLAGDGRNDPIPLSTRLANHKFWAQLFA